jgi:hypothetical protein
MPLVMPCGPTLTAEAALSTATGTYAAWDASKWDAALWGPDIVWTDISAYVRSLQTDRAFSRQQQLWQAGTGGAVLDNRDRRFSPDNMTGPYVVAGVTGVRPWRPIRYRATWAGVTYDLYTGYSLDWMETWVDGHADSTVSVPATDELGQLAAFEGLAVAPVGAGDLSGARAHRLLDNAGHTGLRNIAVGRNTMQATTFSSGTATELALTADSEGGALWVDANGSVMFDDQYALMEQTRSNTIQARFDDGSGGDLPCADVKPAYNGDLISNIAAFQRVGGAVQTATDATSRALYGDKRKTRTDLICETDVQAAALATFWVTRYGQPEQRFSQIVLRPQRDPNRLWPQALGRRIRDLIRVTARPIGGTTVVQDCHIVGIHHQTNGEQWTTTFDLWSAAVYQTFSTSRWNVGLWDSAAWFF